MSNFLSQKHKLLQPERECRMAGFCFIAGVDEVGRGPLAGPVVAAAVRLPWGVKLPAVNDSKKLSESSRIELDLEIRSLLGVEISIAEVSSVEIDKINILRSTHKAMVLAVKKLEKVDFLLIDGRPIPDFGIPMKSIIKGDSKSASIAAASIVAKVYRDKLMDDFDRVYPEYGFSHHKGYGTAEHLEALKKFGATDIHRRSFAPVKAVIEGYPEHPELF